MKKMTIDGRKVSFENEKNLLEVIRKANIEIPTFCYHSDLSIYGACRLCLVEIENRGIMASCSIKPEENMVVRTNTKQIREIRKISVELLLASYDHNCPTCAKNSSCKLQSIAHTLGVTKINFKKSERKQELDYSSPSLVRDPNKCILCGDCVRACNEIQGIGAIDFINRGSNVSVQPAFKKGLAQVDCVNCGQCARVCPTGAIMPQYQTEAVWKEIDNPQKKVVAQIAPAVRVAIGEMFGIPAGTITTGQIVAALRMLGFYKVYDTGFTADLTVIEEATEFLRRKESGKNLPQLTSCCPGWVKYVEQYYPDLIDNLSSCKSPQQMFGSVAKDILPEEFGIRREDLVVVSIMPCTAKKYEASRPEFSENGFRDVDYVLTTQELASMIKQAGIRFNDLTPESLDIPLGFKTGAGIIFGTSGGVTEAVLRFGYEKLKNKKLDFVEFNEVRGNDGFREAEIKIDGTVLRIAIIHSLINAKQVLNDIRQGKSQYDLIEVMACPGGCISGAGQPAYYNDEVKELRRNGIYTCDKTTQLHKSQENPYITKLYEENLGEVGGHKAHRLLHTQYCKRKRIEQEAMTLIDGKTDTLSINVCLGTSCFIKGSQTILKKLMQYVEDNKLRDMVNIKASFCAEQCDKGPSVMIGSEVINHCTFGKAVEAIEKELRNKVKNMEFNSTEVK